MNRLRHTCGLGGRQEWRRGQLAPALQPLAPAGGAVGAARRPTPAPLSRWRSGGLPPAPASAQPPRVSLPLESLCTAGQVSSRTSSEGALSADQGMRTRVNGCLHWAWGRRHPWSKHCLAGPAAGQQLATSALSRPVCCATSRARRRRPTSQCKLCTSCQGWRPAQARQGAHLLVLTAPLVRGTLAPLAGGQAPQLGVAGRAAVLTGALIHKAPAPPSRVPRRQQSCKTAHLSTCLHVSRGSLALGLLARKAGQAKPCTAGSSSRQGALRCAGTARCHKEAIRRVTPKPLRIRAAGCHLGGAEARARRCRARAQAGPCPAPALAADQGAGGGEAPCAGARWLSVRPCRQGWHGRGPAPQRRTWTCY